MSSQTPQPKRRQRSFRRALIYFFRDYMVEIVAGILLIAAGILYLVYSPTFTRVPQTLRDWVQILLQPLISTRDWLLGILYGPNLPEIIFGGLVIMAAATILLRFRYRFKFSKMWNSRSCPRCGEYIQRTHRRPVDRYLAPIFLPDPRRYRCPKCEWEGLRRGSMHRPPS